MALLGRAIYVDGATMVVINFIRIYMVLSVPGIAHVLAICIKFCFRHFPLGRLGML